MSRVRPLALLVAGIAVVTAAACGDNLDSDAGCPMLCPGQTEVLRDTVLDAVVVDSSIAGFPSIGEELSLVIGTRGDTIDTRGIFRFDSLPTQFLRTGAGADSNIQGVDSAFLVMRMDTVSTKPGAAITVSVYDVETGNVDSSAVDTAVAVLEPLFAASHLLGSVTIPPDSVPDSLRVPIASDSLLAVILANQRLRLGVQVTGTNGAVIHVGTVQNSEPAFVQFKPAAAGDTAGITPIQVALKSYTPINNPLATDLSDFLLVVQPPKPAPVPVLGVGGLPARRVYLQFALPPAIADSSTVLRATLELYQIPNPTSINPNDSVYVYPQAVLASAAVTDLHRALSIISNPGDVSLDTRQEFTPADSGLRQFEMVQLVRVWHTILAAADPKAVALVSQLEGSTAALFWFSSSAGPDSLRPRIHITYIPHTAAGGTR